ncbi:type II toxin-antitoxin system RelE/ParE family toxin [Janthinobacterium sp. PSPC3-1]|uniref:type II toxin-antitoxin system RelE/ParE family toxin n=1 Tax=Janthinobacterium sp. PSPC3-1 TaxID=2804653 RepID=UPI003CF9CB54
MSLADRFAVRFTSHAEDDLLRLYAFLLQRDNAGFAVAERALEAIRHAIRGLELSPFSYRKIRADNPFLRELLILFGAAGYVALLEIEEERTVTILAVRHQLEDDWL